ncbi:hypothetical protein [Mycobacterium sp. 94-17]|uniref:hypothetical protein n=1 Tax=Mycobacterium sp. 94-17 TaxID=2986147 RepID=UPI002D1EEDFA|nr:hypothetical protein [Mycobacterium sp. 94-17]MEB4212322.1 hypothetical protein [Mycobacterium sp. 94-17]
MSPPVGSIVRSVDGEWMALPPECCPHGHPLGPGQVLVGHAPCGCGQRGGHMTWTCRRCDVTAYGPPLGQTCRLLNGAGLR